MPPYLVELRRDADTYHMVWAQDAQPTGEGQGQEFQGGLAFAVPVDTDMAAMAEDDRLREVFKRARQHVADEQAKVKRNRDPVPTPSPPGGTGLESGSSRPDPPTR